MDVTNITLPYHRHLGWDSPSGSETSGDIEERRGGWIPHCACAQITDSNDPNNCHYRDGHQENRQHDPDNGGLLGGVGATRGARSHHEHVEQADSSENDHDVEELVGKQRMLQD